MKMSEINELIDKDLIERLENTQSKLRQMKLNHSVSPLENSSEIRNVRRDIARMKTALRQRELKK